MTHPAISVWKELEATIEAQRLNREKMIAGGYGSGVAISALRRAANEVRLKAEHFRAITAPSLTEEQLGVVNSTHERKWAHRKGTPLEPRADDA